MSTFTYLKSFVTDKHVASVTPSSRFCVKRVCNSLDFINTRKIIEYGPGTGVFTKYLLKHLPSEAEIVTMETNKNFVDQLNALQDSRLTVFQDGVENIDKHIKESWYGATDMILSGIPFSFLEESDKEHILETSYRLLRNGGQFLAYQTSGHLKEALQSHFEAMDTEMEWKNLPPMMIYRARKSS